MTATRALTTDLRAQVKLLADDLRQRLEDNQALLADWKRTHHEAQTKERTAMSWVEWREDRIDQAAVAWVLTTVFIRFCEDNSLVKPVWFTGPGRRQEALDGYNAYFRANPEHSDREWLVSAIAYLRKLPATKALVDAHSALEYVSPSGDGVGRLREFWLRRDDYGVLIHDLHDESLSTRFLGDLYQDLSDYAKDKYALLQTPVFVEEFILDRTLEPALAERPIEGFRMIDPTCGSGHFLLGAFERLVGRWHMHAPGMEIQARVQAALDAVHGVDLNPFAVAVARFRLTVAAMKACDLVSLEEAPAFKFHLAVGDSLIHGPDSNTLPGMGDRSAYMPFHYTTEDGSLLLEILDEGRYDVVVGNPPYPTVKDKALNKIYRSKFGKICKGTYALTVPFMVQFFALAVKGNSSGWVGMITSNSFMKREFGVPLIESFLPKVDLRLVIDSEGAWIAGHNTDGTPTVIIVGKAQAPVQQTVRVALSKGARETREYGNEGKGPYWSAIASHWNDPGWDDDWITIADLGRGLLASHPWSLSGGGAVELIQRLESACVARLADRIAEIGFGAVTREDSAYMLGTATLRRNGIAESYRVPIVEGDDTRDWIIANSIVSLWPYDRVSLKAYANREISTLLWPYRSMLSSRVAYGQTQLERGLAWFEYSMFFSKRFRNPQSIAFAFIATHNHFIFDRGGKVFKQSAPIIKLAEGASEEDHLTLLGLLNSSVACFWLKQKSQPKGGSAERTWARTYEFTGTTLGDYPVTSGTPLREATKLDELAQELAVHTPSTVCADTVPTRESLADALKASQDIRCRMIAVQEELDWRVYQLYGLTGENLTCEEDDLPRLALGERAFEIALARNGEQVAWFDQHESKPITDIPSHWPIAYRKLVQRRLNLIAKHPHIKLLEKPEYKRRWAQESWGKLQEQALAAWLLDRLEERRLWLDSQGRPSPRSVAQLADEVSRDVYMVSVLALWEGRPDVPVAESLKRLLENEAVPMHSGYRYKDPGISKRMAWENTWAMQRRHDAGYKVRIDVPPKYTSTDFTKPSYWRHRGKLDMPKERFILYPDASRDGDDTPLLGWAGWDHAEQALALASVIHDREQEGWPDEGLVPLIAGLAELQPWVDQWHGEVHPLYGVSLAAFCAEELARRAAQVSMTVEELRWWRPEKKKGRGRGKA